ncbi:MAG TPA: FMN-binding negative transcriptional regulator [Casimicrobiaceae bacterium]
MYVPQHFAETDNAVLHALIRAHPLGTWVTAGDDGLVANHIPFLIDPARGERGTLIAHVARANPIWRTFSTAVPSLVVFQGAQAYITPSWYPSKQAHGKAVPTWNYVVVHAHGMPRAIEDRAWLRKHLDALVSVHEAPMTVPWKIADAPADFIDGLLRVIVGIEIPIATLTGKWKVSQNRPEPDKVGVVAGLGARGDASSTAMAELVRQHMPSSAEG